MVKRTLIAIALMAVVASTAPAMDVYYWGPMGGYLDKESGVKVDGYYDKVLWPVEYKALPICKMKVLMEVGMYVDVQDCKDKKIKLIQVDCGDIGKGSNDFPCYNDCETIKIRANFEVKLGTSLEKIGNIIDEWEGYYDGGNDVVVGDGQYHSVSVCVRAWKARLYNAGSGDNPSPGHEKEVGTLYVTAKPNLALPYEEHGGFTN